MALLLFTDFGASDLYVGQVESVVDRYAPGVRIIHLLNEAPRFNVVASAHLLAAMAVQVPRGHVFLAIVDPSVGSERGGIVARIDGRTYVAPDNGLLSVLWTRGTVKSVWKITTWPDTASVSFHGRDVFAPAAAAVATGEFPNETVTQIAEPSALLPGDDLAEIIYIDHYGNAMTGLRGQGQSTERQLVIGDLRIGHARVFHDAPKGRPFWYANSIGLIEVAMPGEDAAEALNLRIGQPVGWAA